MLALRQKNRMMHILLSLFFILFFDFHDTLASRAPGYDPPFVEQIPMRDGKSLAADVYLPKAGQSWPTILIQTPYNRLFYRIAGLPLPTSDYAFVIVDWRGFWGSASAAAPFPHYGRDGYDCVEWIAGQAWSDGHVGTWGASALGGVQYQTAREHPPHLDACVPLVRDMQFDYRHYYPGGALREELLRVYQIVGYTIQGTIVKHPTHDLWWQSMEQASRYADEIDVPMFIIGGWYDIDVPGFMKTYRWLSHYGDPAARDEHRLMIGPWEHGKEGELKQGELQYPGAEGFAQRAAVLFLDKWCRGIGSGLPGMRVHFFDMGTRQWHEADEWLAAGTEDLRLYLQPGGGLHIDQPPLGSAADDLPYDPLDPCPTLGGAVIMPNIPSGPRDLRSGVEDRSDVLVYTTPPLPENVTLAGAPSALLHASSDRRDTDFMVRLTDVYPDGRSMLVVDGACRGRFRDGTDEEKLMTPGVVYKIPVGMSETAITFPAGHRIRIVISSSNHPRFHANPNDGGPLYDPGATPLFASNKIYHDPGRPSCVILPILK